MPREITKWSPQPGPQQELLNADAFEVFYGGARGGGKTDGLLGDYLQDVESWGSSWRGILIRRSYPELEDVIVRSKEIFPAYGGRWQEQKRTWTFPSGAYLRLRFMEHDDDWMKYQGHSYSWIGWDELPQHPVPSNYEKMLACARSAKGAPVRVRASGNPGCPGQIWVKDRFIDVAPPKTTIKIELEGGQEITRLFIPASVYDNKILLQNDSRYLAVLMGLSPGLKKAWLEGDWSTSFGQMFAWVPRYHVLKGGPWPPPDYAEIFEVIDYGTAKPFSVGWYWVDLDGQIFRAREWYGWNGEANEGIRLPPSEIAAGIKKLEEQWGIWGRVKVRWAADNYMFTKKRNTLTQETGPTINEAFMGIDSQLIHMEGDWRHRVRGVAQCHERLRLVFNEDGKLAEPPMFQVYEECTHFIRTVPNLVQDKHNPEDVDCFIAGTLIDTPLGPCAIEDLQIGQMVNTPIGPRMIKKTGLAGYEPTIQIKLSNGLVLEGTQDHKIFIENGGLLPLYLVSSGHKLFSREQGKWFNGFIEESYFGNIHGKDILNVIQSMLKCSVELPYCTELFGKTTSEQFHPDFVFTIKTTIPPIMQLKIWNWFIRRFMGDTISKKDLQPVAISQQSLKTGENQNKENAFFAKTLQNADRILQNENLRALIVANILQQNILHKNTVQSCVKNDLISHYSRFVPYVAKNFEQNDIIRKKYAPVVISVDGHLEKKAVYYLTVEQAHLFYANGILSANTEQEDHVFDEWKTAMLTRPLTPKKPLPTKVGPARLIAQIEQPRPPDDMNPLLLDMGGSEDGDNFFEEEW